jgi:hypothetical protein
MSWNPTDDYRPSPPPIADDMEDVQTSWGILPRWKARALALGEIQAVVNELRADSAAGTASKLAPEDKAPPLAADADEPPAIDPDLLDAIDAKLEELAIRMDRLERMKAAEQALLDLEDRIEAQLSPDTGDDDGDLIKVH